MKALEPCLQWSLFSENTKSFAPSEPAFMINYRVVGSDALLATLSAVGIAQVGEIARTEYGDVGHVMDPEGNKIELRDLLLRRHLCSW